MSAIFVVYATVTDRDKARVKALGRMSPPYADAGHGGAYRQDPRRAGRQITMWSTPTM
jgi:hypothetical protein